MKKLFRTILVVLFLQFLFFTLVCYADTVKLEKAEVIRTEKNSKDSWFVRGTIKVNDPYDKHNNAGIEYSLDNKKCYEEKADYIMTVDGFSYYSFCTNTYLYSPNFQFECKVFYKTKNDEYWDDNHGVNYYFDTNHLVIENMEPGVPSPVEEPDDLGEYEYASPNIKRMWVESQKAVLIMMVWLMRILSQVMDMTEKIIFISIQAAVSKT